MCSIHLAGVEAGDLCSTAVACHIYTQHDDGGQRIFHFLRFWFLTTTKLEMRHKLNVRHDDKIELGECTKDT